MNRIVLSILLFVLVQSSAILSKISANYLMHSDVAGEIKTRIGLDLSSIDLGTENAQSVANETDVQRYLTDLNEYLLSQDLPVLVHGLQGVGVSNLPPQYSRELVEKLSTNNSSIVIDMLAKPIVTDLSFSYSGLVVSLLFYFLPRLSSSNEHTSKQPSKNNKTASVNLPTPKQSIKNSDGEKLFVDIKSKTLYLKNQGDPVELSNKPFCFYVALLKYCISDNTTPLIHHEAIPEDLLNYADETFQQLMDLGHTKRRQPDFSSNLDKTLSEIRAALDEVFKLNLDKKAPFYPPKAQGEGSRTKRHSYALNNLKSQSVVFVRD